MDSPSAGQARKRIILTGRLTTGSARLDRLANYEDWLSCVEVATIYICSVTRPLRER